jgi:transposase
MEHTTIAVDLAKSVFQIAVSRRPGYVDDERRVTRARLREYFAQQPVASVVLEACGSAHYWARELQQFGHTVRLLPAHDVHRYVRRNKTDRTDTKALLEASRNEDIRSVPIKSVDQQAIASLHRLRSTWQATRTARINTVRGLLGEFGITMPVGARHVVPQVRMLVEDATTSVPMVLRTVLVETCDEIDVLEERVAQVDRQLAAVARQLPDVVLLQTVPGIGLITATALVALVGSVQRFPSGRHFASYLGLTPKEDSSASRRRLGAISKKGDTYLRMLLIHGARAVLWSARSRKEPTPLQAWALRTQAHRGHNVAAVAVANKLARIVWAVWTQQRPFTASHLAPDDVTAR